jgi:hypothetical protein
VEQMREDMKQYKYQEKYGIISYKTLLNELKDVGEAYGDVQFGIFISALQKHCYASIPKAKYEEMKNKFINRITEKINFAN